MPVIHPGPVARAWLPLLILAAMLIARPASATAQEAAGSPGPAPADSPADQSPDQSADQSPDVEPKDPAPADHRVALDLYAFSQSDNGNGNIYAQEGFNYIGARASIDLHVESAVDFKARIATSYINNADLLNLPLSIINAATTSASADLVTLTISAAVDVKVPDTPVRGSFGLYYHHQLDLISGGFDLAVLLDLFDDTTTLSLTYNFRGDYHELDYWDGTFRESDETFSHNFMLGWDQVVSDSVRTRLVLQYTNQHGFLSDQLNYVTLFNAGGQPFFLIDEILPEQRNRLQVSGRVRWSPWAGGSLGLDASYYQDDWDIRHVAVEWSLEFPFGEGVQVRLWHRVADQQGTKYLVLMPRSPGPPLRTQDSDLATFSLHTGGLLVRVNLQDAVRGSVGWELSVSLFGFVRSDGIDALGGTLGVIATW
ncbi:MAG: DUF3570 domain-containing protein [Planctomycetota bacterium]